MRDKKIFYVHERKTLAFLMGTVYHSHIRNARPNFKSFFGGFFTMIYHSTRNEQLTASSTHAVLQGIAPDGGLYICDPAALRFDCTAETALATSVLYLVPGVPLINGVIDIVEGHILIGFSRLINALLLIICIAIGLSATLLMVKNSLL